MRSYRASRGGGSARAEWRRLRRAASLRAIAARTRSPSDRGTRGRVRSARSPMMSSARATASSGPPQPGQRSSRCASAGPSRQTRAWHATHFRCAMSSSAPSRAQPLVGGAGGAFELAQATGAGRFRAHDPSAVERESVTVVTSFRVQPGALGSVSGGHVGPPSSSLRRTDDGRGSRPGGGRTRTRLVQ
jgi:hypothetical protein